MLALPSTITTTSQNAGMYAPPAALGPKRRHTCGIVPAHLHLVVEDAPRAAAAGEHLDLVGDARARRVDQVEHRHAERDAVSLMRRIFSTVRSPHEPAFTVESLAMMATGRPATWPVPVTTPSAGRPRPSRWRAGRPRRSCPRRRGADALAREELAPGGRGLVVAGAPPRSMRARAAATESAVEGASGAAEEVAADEAAGAGEAAAEGAAAGSAGGVEPVAGPAGCAFTLGERTPAARRL